MAEQKVVVITGASGGIARATARAFGARGDRVALLARGEAGLAGAKHDIESGGGQALVHSHRCRRPCTGRGGRG